MGWYRCGAVVELAMVGGSLPAVVEAGEGFEQEGEGGDEECSVQTQPEVIGGSAGYDEVGSARPAAVPS